jgi:hypothetical protein
MSFVGQKSVANFTIRSSDGQKVHIENIFIQTQARKTNGNVPNLDIGRNVLLS